jgi:phosphoribosylcarboxyaminoimidazole (NCAIR) mutase
MLQRILDRAVKNFQQLEKRSKQMHLIKKTIDIAINNSFGLALIKGAMAIIAVAPQIAVPAEINKVNFLSSPSNFPSNIPIKNINKTKIDINGK